MIFTVCGLAVVIMITPLGERLMPDVSDFVRYSIAVSVLLFGVIAALLPYVRLARRQNP